MLEKKHKSWIITVKNQIRKPAVTHIISIPHHPNVIDILDRVLEDDLLLAIIILQATRLQLLQAKVKKK